MANSELKLYYFNGKGRVEVARLILAAAGKKYEDIRFEETDWPKYKHIAPFGQAPLLEVDGKIYAQSLAIKTFLAREFGYHGNTNLESLEIDQVLQLIEDMVNASVGPMFVEDEAERKKGMEKLKTEGNPKFLGFLEKLLEKNKTGWFVGDRITVADIAVFDIFTGMLEAVVDLNASYPLLQKNVQKVRGHNNLGAYADARPVTAF